MSRVLSFPKGFLWGVSLPAFRSWVSHENSKAVLGLLAGMPPRGMVHVVLDWEVLEPEEGRFENSVLGEMAGTLQALRAMEWKIIVTLTGSTLPPWARSRGGWSNARILDRFDLYAAWCSSILGPFADYWGTVEKPAWMVLDRSPWNSLSPGETWKAWPALANIMSAHGRAFRILKRETPETPVGLCHALDTMEPLRRDWAPDRWAAGLMDGFANQGVLDALSLGWLQSPWGKFRVPEAKGTLDFLGLSYATRIQWTFNLAHSRGTFMERVDVPGVPRGDGGEALYPRGFAPAIRRARNLGKPLFILNNSIVDAADTRRPGSLAAHLQVLHGMLQESPPIQGYLYGPLVDGGEDDPGGARAEGLFTNAGDGKTAKARPSAALFAEIWRENAMASILTRQFGTALLLEGPA